jgi:hypothetical protein
MKNLTFALGALTLVGAALFYYYPEQVYSLLGQTPLQALMETSKPLYQWRDEQGQWHATDEPPPGGIPYEVKRYALDANVVPPHTLDKE